MFKEPKSLEYAIEIIRVLSKTQGIQGSKEIYRLVAEHGRIECSLTYIQKLLPKLVKAGILVSSDTGYILGIPAEEVTISAVLSVCDMPSKSSMIYPLCEHLIEAFTLTTVNELFDLS
jgi:DNA-binding IscR family transcriptional regulator